MGSRKLGLMSCPNVVIGHPLAALAMDSRQKRAGMTGLRRRFEKVYGSEFGDRNCLPIN